MPRGAGFQGGQRSLRGFSSFALARPRAGDHEQNCNQMGFLNLLTKRGSQTGANLVRLPTGSFTLDPGGRAVAPTPPPSLPPGEGRQIRGLVLSPFLAARAA